MTVEELSALIEQTPGEGIIFYTGAGISRGGELPVWDMNTLNDRLHFFLEGMHDRSDPQGAVRTFLPAFINHPEQLTQAFSQFNEQLYADSSTPAHIAIAEIVESKPGSIVLTENVDKKHEAKGARISAVHLDSKRETFDKVKMRADKTQLLITVGLSVDDRAVIAFLKNKNPHLKIVALSLSPQEQGDIPTYLQGDFLVAGDCQQILPVVASKLNLTKDKDNE